MNYGLDENAPIDEVLSIVWQQTIPALECHACSPHRHTAADREGSVAPPGAAPGGTRSMHGQPVKPHPHPESIRHHSLGPRRRPDGACSLNLFRRRPAFDHHRRRHRRPCGSFLVNQRTTEEKSAACDGRLRTRPPVSVVRISSGRGPLTAGRRWGLAGGPGCWPPWAITARVLSLPDFVRRVEVHPIP